VTYEEFAGLAGQMWDQIPPGMKEGVAAVTVDESTVEHDYLEAVYTLGQCAAAEMGSGHVGPDDVRSKVVLYHGSFAVLAGREPGFDWEGELWETLLHELLHHREAAAGESGLDEYDWAVEQNQRRHAGEPFDPAFYTAVPRATDGAVRLESEIFLEAVVDPAATEAVFEWRGKAYSAHIPAAAPAFVEIANLAGGRLWLVVRRRRRWWQRLFGSRVDMKPLDLTRRALPVPSDGAMM